MKKNRMMRLASVLLVLTLLSTSVISGTFAKYVTSDSAKDTARVAKWGVEVSVDAEDAFANQYARTSDGTVSEYTVISAETSEDVVAPGTNGTLGTIQITGKPEVETVVKTIVDVELSAGWQYVDGDTTENYFPIVIKVGGTAVSYNSNSNLEEIEKAVEDAIIKAILVNEVTTYAHGSGKSASKHYAPNSDELADASAITVSWEWPFEGNDVKDTYLGNNNEAATISVSIDVTVEQVD